MHASALLALLPAFVAATTVPTYSGYSVTWHDDFWGNAGSSPNASAWNTITGDLNVNNELETYSDASTNVQVSGGGTLQLVPWRDSSATNGWTSGRIESTGSHTPSDGKKTRIEASIRMGDASSSTQAGIWPAFWMLGESMREGTSWPTCGELDILEQLNGVLTGYGTAHCDDLCDGSSGLQGSTDISSGYEFHTWRLDFDRTASSWEDETITWSLDGNSFFTISGSTIGDQSTWSTLAHSPFYILLNVAVGGDWGGDPTSSTVDGYESMMEVAYVAVYSS